MQGLSRTSQILQKAITVLGIFSLILGLAGAVTAATGVGAGLLAASSILGLICLCCAGVVFILQSVLAVTNLVQVKSWSDEQKHRFWADVAAGIGAALAAAALGIGIDFSSFIPGAAGAALDPALVGIPSKVGQNIASTGLGQVFGTTSDITSETVGVLTAKEDGTPEPAPSGQVTPEMVKAAVAEIVPLVVGEGAASKTQAIKDQQGLAESLKAVNQAIEKLNTPLDQVPAPEKVKKPEKGMKISIAQGAEQAPGMLDEANKSIDKGIQDTSKPEHVDEPKEPMLAEAERGVDKAEAEMGGEAQPAEPQKLSVGQRVKGWFSTRFMRLKKRIARLLASAKAKILSVTMQVLGISGPMKDLGVELADKQVQTPQGIKDAVGVATEATKATADAKQLQEVTNKLF